MRATMSQQVWYFRMLGAASITFPLNQGLNGVEYLLFARVEYDQFH